MIQILFLDRKLHWKIYLDIQTDWCTNILTKSYRYMSINDYLLIKWHFGFIHCHSYLIVQFFRFQRWKIRHQLKLLNVRDTHWIWKIKRIITFLRFISSNNSEPWYQIDNKKTRNKQEHDGKKQKGKKIVLNHFAFFYYILMAKHKIEVVLKFVLKPLLIKQSGLK